jgi:hypothetical protein
MKSADGDSLSGLDSSERLAADKRSNRKRGRDQFLRPLRNEPFRSGKILGVSSQSSL